jgi:hypothetical protein
MVSKKLSETVKQFYLSGRLDEDFVMDAVKHTLGGEVNRSSKYEDTEKHVDFWWDSPRKGRIGIDVKGLNKNKRGDKQYDDSIHWLELQNVKGKDGWLRGEAEYIAFRTNSNIIFVNREKLLDFALEAIKNKEVVHDTPRECYVPYKRSKWGRDDLSLKALTSDLLKLADFTIEFD